MPIAYEVDRDSASLALPVRSAGGFAVTSPYHTPSRAYDLIRSMDDRESSAFARIASALAFKKSRKVRSTAETSPGGHTTIRSRCRLFGTRRTNCTPFDRRLLEEAGTMATPSSASTNDRIVCIEFGSFSARGEKP